jgi:hypothetical protein
MYEECIFSFCDAGCEGKEFVQNFSGEPLGKRSLGRQRKRREDRYYLGVRQIML